MAMAQHQVCLKRKPLRVEHLIVRLAVLHPSLRRRIIGNSNRFPQILKYNCFLMISPWPAVAKPLLGISSTACPVLVSRTVAMG